MPADQLSSPGQPVLVKHADDSSEATPAACTCERCNDQDAGSSSGSFSLVLHILLHHGLVQHLSGPTSGSSRIQAHWDLKALRLACRQARYEALPQSQLHVPPPLPQALPRRTPPARALAAHHAAITQPGWELRVACTPVTTEHGGPPRMRLLRHPLAVLLQLADQLPREAKGHPAAEGVALCVSWAVAVPGALCMLYYLVRVLDTALYMSWKYGHNILYGIVVAMLACVAGLLLSLLCELWTARWRLPDACAQLRATPFVFPQLLPTADTYLARYAEAFGDGGIPATRLTLTLSAPRREEFPSIEKACEGFLNRLLALERFAWQDPRQTCWLPAGVAGCLLRRCTRLQALELRSEHYLTERLDVGNVAALVHTLAAHCSGGLVALTLCGVRPTPELLSALLGLPQLRKLATDWSLPWHELPGLLSLTHGSLPQVEELWMDLYGGSSMCGDLDAPAPFPAVHTLRRAMPSAYASGSRNLKGLLMRLSALDVATAMPALRAMHGFCMEVPLTRRRSETDASVQGVALAQRMHASAVALARLAQRLGARGDPWVFSLQEDAAASRLHEFLGAVQLEHACIAVERLSAWAEMHTESAWWRQAADTVAAVAGALPGLKQLDVCVPDGPNAHIAANRQGAARLERLELCALLRGVAPRLPPGVRTLRLSPLRMHDMDTLRAALPLLREAAAAAPALQRLEVDVGDAVWSPDRSIHTQVSGMANARGERVVIGTWLRGYD